VYTVKLALDFIKVQIYLIDGDAKACIRKIVNAKNHGCFDFVKQKERKKTDPDREYISILCVNSVQQLLPGIFPELLNAFDKTEHTFHVYLLT